MSIEAAVIALCWAVGIAAIHVLAAAVVVVWIGAGEPDVNGDPERDAGWSDDDLERMASAWDHGSADTAEVHPEHSPAGHRA